MREHRCALAHRVDVDRQLEVAQVVDERRLEQRPAARGGKRAEVGEVIFGEAEALHQIRQVRHAARDGVAALEGVVAKRHVEARLGVRLAALQIALRHRELVQVGE